MKVTEDTMENKTLIVGIDNSTRTVDIMDEFETLTEEGFQKYEQMQITNRYFIGNYGVSFLIKRLIAGTDYVGKIT